MKEDHKEFKDLPPFPELNSDRTIANIFFTGTKIDKNSL
jgi:hypothetical protein